MRHLRPRAPDAGETLIEALVTIAILGIAVVVLLSAILIGVKTSVAHRKHAQAQGELRSWAERITSRAYVDCADPVTFGGPGALPEGLSGNVIAVQYWDGTKFVPRGCAGPAGDKGLQKVSLRLHVADGIAPGFTQDLDVVVRRP